MNVGNLTIRSRYVQLLVGWILALLVLWQGAQLVFRSDPRDELRRGDALFEARRYHDARAIYYALGRQRPNWAAILVRQGMIETVRADYLTAQRALGSAIGMGLRGEEHDLARLYQGHISATLGRRDEAAGYWSTIVQRSSIYPLRRALEAESLLRSGDYAGAEATYRDALSLRLPAEWRILVQTRLATLRASSDPDRALVELAPPPAALAAPAAPSTVAALGAPLLPPIQPDPQTLAAALRADATQRPQLLGQLYLDSRMYTLAEAQFAGVTPDNPHALAAATYAAYTRWLAGDQVGGLERLQSIVADHPDEPRARALLALTYLAGKDAQRAQEQLHTIRGMAPRAPDTHLAWGQWYAAQSDYVAAADAYRRALDDAPTDLRGVYALALARFHRDTSVRLCEDGRPAANEATHLLPNDPNAWTTLAAISFRCNDPAAAQNAAAQALIYDPTNAEATYYLGRALAQLGDRAGARTALIKAADLAPASAWRERAETQLRVLGL
jgi:tetratricopeptide (TPR) repeat protein